MPKCTCGNVNGPSAENCSRCGKTFPPDAESFIKADAASTVSDLESETTLKEGQPSAVLVEEQPSTVEPAVEVEAADNSVVNTETEVTVPKCSKCGREDNKLGAKFCGSCGTKLSTTEVETKVDPAPETITCPDCNLANPIDTKFCDDCGKQLGEIDQPPPKDPNTPQVELTPAELAELTYREAVDNPVTVTAAGAAHRGLPYEAGGKDYDEDTFLVKDIPYPVHGFAVKVLLVADGIGTPPAGEVFAETAVHSLWTGIRSPLVLPYAEQQHGEGRFGFGQLIDSNLSQNLPAVIRSVEEQLHQLRNFWNLELSGGENDGMPSGTTIAFVVAICDLQKGHLVLHAYHDGNSRILLVSNNEVLELSRISDHSLPDGSLLSFFGSTLHPHGTPSGNLTRHEIWLDEENLDSLAIVLCTDGVEREIEPNLPQWLQDAHSAADFAAKAVEWAVNPTSAKKAGLDNAAFAAMIVRKDEREQTEES